MTNPSFQSAPVLQTDRLVLSGHTLADFAECAAMWGDPQVTRFIGGKPSTDEETWGRMLRYGGLWPLLGYGYWMVRERETGRYVGDVGIADFHRDIVPALGDVPEAGWVLAPWSHGRGFATEAVREVLAWRDEHLAATSTVALIAPENAASIHVAEKCGFREQSRGVYKGGETIVFERTIS